MVEYLVKIDAFEGPLDLLLHLINRLEIDIYDIPVSEITGQYVAYIHTMQELELDVASEYLVMAATLLSIKSRMLLPQQEETLMDDVPVEEEDPREELVNRLIEYRKYKEAAIKLKAKEEERAQVFTKPPSDLSDFAINEQVVKQQSDVTIYDMIGAFQKMLRRKKLQKPLSTRITRQEIPIEKRMNEIIEDLRINRVKRHFYDLFPAHQKEYLVVTFLAILELMKKQYIHIEQERNFSDIYIYGSEKIDELRDH
ncbi:segregation/condensation protein A [Bacillus sp. FJAT-47783]|uniref:segregation/condensation protein A n=1 Tax=Bacillus sp. FJAT-47783 TaxID=2922712 RepID=UPI001FACC01F|nr:segregation/condensation protein A [Bacillus sp. FJAT-47783]